MSDDGRWNANQAQGSYELWYWDNAAAVGHYVNPLRGKVVELTEEAFQAMKTREVARLERELQAMEAEHNARYPQVNCDLCGKEHRVSAGDRATKDVLFCWDCTFNYPKHEALEPYKRPWWLRVLKWLGRL
jgi:hypothetical protein